MDRAHFQKLSQALLGDARALLTAKRWARAYYLAGYAVECGLKACVLVRVAGAAEVIFADRRFSEKCWTHDLEQLVQLAGLAAAFAADRQADPTLEDNWTTVQEWSEASRYERTRKKEAMNLYQAIADRNHGVLRWIKSCW